MFLLPNNIFLPLEASDSMARQMKANPNFMKNLLKRHIIMSQKIMPSDIQNEMLVPAMSGDVLRFNTFDKVSCATYYIVRTSTLIKRILAATEIIAYIYCIFLKIES